MDIRYEWRKLFSRYSITLLLLLVLFYSSLVVAAASCISKPDIRIRIIDQKVGGCGGILNNSGIITNWDTSSVHSFSLGVANNGTKAQTLEQVNVTITGHFSANYSYFEIIKSITGEGGLPVILLPRQYWQWDFTLEFCTDTIAVQLVVDNKTIDFGVIASGHRGFQSKWLSTWSNAGYSTISPTLSLSTLSALSVIVISIVVVIFRRSRNS